jgi:hypothetical protein
MECMEENPYKSPKAVPKVEKLPAQSAPEVAKRPSRLFKRYFFAPLFGFVAFGGLFCFELGMILAAFELGLLSGSLELPGGLEWLVWCALAVVPLSSGAAIAFWTWWNPESKWALAVALLLGLSYLIPLFIGIFFS